ncbi:mitochondrial ribosomal protein subunit L2 [Schizosaccharomyces pombe]|uniref:Large ribosomal subunit protein uL2m n=1 Tax=Schizosaccharomyces pombe (strain 972 / ATCC 24843) TaxID=284812 RepID=RML2_SCHPO|nr:putative mitochondrial ribosomal protein subunit L2 [Schizosaccharomyces pombe]Q9Y7P4.2 RecName: Full=Large ribosomal subunit protein uL2m; AltName: Full=54S ribosomal protein rml2, mitochondrial; Short=L2; Flags: Precursor [Schizosaccharomyces pombe 972h-]CAB38631.2 mitochondrial ribosomal protein subunit L2 (predicted) [Schizosaccharomyces pombe]|eukprot:NP_587925.2 putative mitochondrial ribosomal protein subunit L2 [Schizosaccharomyces pombe]
MLSYNRFRGYLIPQIHALKLFRYASTASTSGEKIESSERPYDVGMLLRPKTKFEIKTYKPISPGLRHLKRPVSDYLWKGKPFRPLTVAKRKKGGRNETGRITVRHQGGGHKQRIRLVDFERKVPGVHRVIRIEYDPGRSGHIALVEKLNSETANKSYILACDGLREGDTVESFRSLLKTGSNGEPVEMDPVLAAEIEDGTFAAKNLKPGNCFPLRLIPIGTVIHAIGVNPNQKAKLCRSAGSSARIIAFDGKYAIVRLQSGEERKILDTSFATIGVVSNIYWQHRQLGKAGRSRWLGIRPTVRGTAMNPCDHPHGGGGGKSIGNKPSQSPWGVLAKGGYKTRRGKNVNKLLVRDRPRGKEKR